MSTIERGILIMQALAEYGKPAALGELSSATGLASSTIHRILSALQAQGFVDQDGRDRKYRLGYGLVALAQSAIRTSPRYHDLTPFLAEIRDRWHEGCFVATLADSQVICMQTMEVNDAHAVGFYYRPAQVMPIHCAAAGKVILAFQDPAKIDQILAETTMRSFTEHTITDAAQLKEHLELIRQRGYALCEDELELGVSGAAVPIRDGEGCVIWSLAVVAPSVRLHRHLGLGLIDSLVDIRRRIMTCLT